MGCASGAALTPSPERDRGTMIANLPTWVQEAHLVDLPMTTRFRGLTRRRALIVRGLAGWAEWSPFEEYGPAEAMTWWRATLEAATLGFPAPVRTQVPVNVTVPAESAAAAHARVGASGCRTAKVKVAEAGQAASEDIDRVEAVRAALGPSGRVRVDANGAWPVATALTMIKALRRFDLEYVEQPCATVEELTDLRQELARRGWNVLVAADESIRRSGDPERVAQGAADVAVIKVQPLGGVRACLDLAERLGLPVVVSSALETSVGLQMGLALAAALPELPFACGLNTAALLAEDVVDVPLVEQNGMIMVRDVVPDRGRLQKLQAGTEAVQAWSQRLSAVLASSDGGRNE